MSLVCGSLPAGSPTLTIRHFFVILALHTAVSAGMFVYARRLALSESERYALQLGNAFPRLELARGGVVAAHFSPGSLTVVVFFSHFDSLCRAVEPTLERWKQLFEGSISIMIVRLGVSDGDLQVLPRDFTRLPSHLPSAVIVNDGRILESVVHGIDQIEALLRVALADRKGMGC